MIFQYMIAIISIGALFLIWIAADYFCRKLSSRSSENLVGEENPTCHEPRRGPPWGGAPCRGGSCKNKCNGIEGQLIK